MACKKTFQKERKNVFLIRCCLVNPWISKYSNSYLRSPLVYNNIYVSIFIAELWSKNNEIWIENIDTKWLEIFLPKLNRIRRRKSYWEGANLTARYTFARIANSSISIWFNLLEKSLSSKKWKISTKIY